VIRDERYAVGQEAADATFERHSVAAIYAFRHAPFLSSGLEVIFVVVDSFDGGCGFACGGG
jgi:hypothetical protein